MTRVEKFIEAADDDEMAEMMVECISWLSDKGRYGARRIKKYAGPDLNFGEANAWLEDLENGKEV